MSKGLNTASNNSLRQGTTEHCVPKKLSSLAAMMVSARRKICIMTIGHTWNNKRRPLGYCAPYTRTQEHTLLRTCVINFIIANFAKDFIEIISRNDEQSKKQTTKFTVNFAIH